MKFRNIFRIVLLIAIIVPVIISCANDDNKNTVDDIEDTLQEGSWKVAYFYHSSEDKTQNYAGYNFVFSEDIVVTVTKGTDTYSGSWFISKSTSDADLFSNIFKLSLESPEVLIQLNGDWKVMENTGKFLMLKDDSKGDSAINHLTFEKIE